jgi:hypothetical protein
MMAMVEDWLFEVGKASVHPEKVSTGTRRYWCHLMGVI